MEYSRRFIGSERTTKSKRCWQSRWLRRISLRLLKGSDTIPQQDSNENLAVKLLRTFAAQTEASQRYRGKGQQKVTVEHVHVHTGGQAIVGSVSQSGGGRDSDENRGQPHAPENAGAITFAPGATLPSTDKAWNPCQSPAVAGKTRCRMHGGAAGSGAPKGRRNGKYRHGGFTLEAIDERVSRH
jgi:hypothetical protein